MKITHITGITASLLAALAVITSCNSEDAPATYSNIITFASPVTEGITRAVPGEIPTTYPTNESFMVFGKRYKSPYQGWDATPKGWGDDTGYKEKGEKTIYDGAKYKGWLVENHLYQWDNGMDYTFAAYSPADAAGAISYGADGLTVGDFTPAALGQQYDLLYSKRIYGISRNNMVSGTYNGVPITFYHALSSIIIKIGVHPAFIAEMEGKGTPLNPGDFKIKSISLKGVVSKGTFNQNINEDVPNVTYTEAPAWTLSTEGTDVTEYKVLDKTASPVNIPIIGIEQNPTKELSNSVLPITDSTIGGNLAILIPQPLTNRTLEIVWTSNGNDGKDGSGATYVTSTIDLSKYGSWVMGYRYTYTIAFQRDRIYFAPTPDKMGEGDGIILN